MSKIPLSEYWALLRRYLNRQRGTAALMAAALLIGIVLQLAGPQVVRGFIDAAQSGTDEASLVGLALVFIGVSLMQQVMRVLAVYWSERVAWTATNALRADLTAHIMRLDLSFHKTRTPGELIERVDGDVNALAGFFSSFVIQVVGSGLLLVGVVIAMFGVDLRMGLAFAGFAIGALIILNRVRLVGARYRKEDMDRSAAFYGYMGEVLSATEDLRSSGAVDYALRRFYQHLRGWLPVMRRSELAGSTIWMAAVGVFAVGDALAYGLGGGLYRADVISLGAVYMLVAYTAMLADPIETIRAQLQDLQRADAAISRVRELFAVKSRLADGAQVLSDGALAVSFHDVTFAYQDNEHSENNENNENDEIVLENLSFTLPAGRVLGLLGHTGSGKSTLARLLFRFYDPQKGSICLNEHDLRDLKLASVREHIGLVTQDVQLFEASLRDNITFFDSTVSDVHLLEVLNTLGLAAWLARLTDGLNTVISPGALSAGEAQLIALARVFIKNPGLVIMDEASSRLDPATEALLERALDALLTGRTVMIIAHRLATLERADDILILENGRVLEHGNRAALAADPTSKFAQLRQIGLTEVMA